MSRGEGLAILLDELAAMPAASRKAILRSLSPAERDALASVPEFVRGPEPVVANTSPFSPWLVARLEAARSQSSLDLTASRMTMAAKQALVRSADMASARTEAQPTPPAPGKSLFDTFGGKLAARMGRP